MTVSANDLLENLIDKIEGDIEEALMTAIEEIKKAIKQNNVNNFMCCPILVFYNSTTLIANFNKKCCERQRHARSCIFDVRMGKRKKLGRRSKII